MLDPLDDPNSTTTSREDVDADLDKRRKVRDYNEENWFYWLRIVGAIVVTALTFALVIVYGSSTSRMGRIMCRARTTSSCVA